MRDENLFGKKLTARQVAMKKMTHLVRTDRDQAAIIADAIDEGVKIGKADALALFNATTTAVETAKTRGGRENVVAVIYLFDNEDAAHANHIINSSVVTVNAMIGCSAYRVVDERCEMG